MASRKLVLVVDDEEDIRFVVEMLLKRHGYDVETAEDGLQALEKVKQKHYDLIILDILMPKMDGYEVAKNLGEMGITTPIIMLTAKADDKSMWEGFRHGATLYVPKPFENKYLLDAVNYLIGDLTEQERREIERRL